MQTEMKANKVSSGSKPALKLVKVLPDQHELIMKTVKELNKIFVKKARELKIPARSKGKFRNTPGQPEAVKFLTECQDTEEHREAYIDSLIKAQGAQ